jgi:hypothetical protein
MHKYKKNRKKKLKREKKRVFSAIWARGDFGPASPRKGGTARANVVVRTGHWWRFFAGGPVLRRRSGGKARAEVGDYRGGANLASGRSGWPVHGEVAGVHGGGIASEVAGRNR